MSGLTLSLAGKTALVTGGSSGLGPSIVSKLDEAGAKVVVHYHANHKGAEDIVSTLKQPSLIAQANLSDSGDVDRLFKRACELSGSVDVLINCAAAESQNVGDFVDLTDERWATTMATNVDAPRILTQHIARQNKPAAIINISSIEATRPASGHSHYGTSKAALEAMTRVAALELGHLSIRVNAIAPGLIHRDGIEEGWPDGVKRWNSISPLNKLVSPEEIGTAVVYLACDQASSITGTVLTIDAGLATHPGW